MKIILMRFITCYLLWESKPCWTDLQSKLSLLFGPQFSHSPHWKRQGPEGPHSQNLLQSEIIQIPLGHYHHHHHTLTVLVDVVVGGDVIEEVLAVWDEAPIVGLAVWVQGWCRVGGQPDLLLADQVLGLTQPDGRQQDRQRAHGHSAGSLTPHSEDQEIIKFLILLYHSAKPAKLNSLISRSEQKSAKAK